MNIEEVNNPGYEQPRKSGRSWMACFGIGCVALLALCAVGAVITYFTAGPSIQAMIEQVQIQQQNMSMAMESELIKEKLGSPVTPVIEIAAPEVEIDGEVQLITSRQKLKGSEAEGYLVSQVRIEPGKPVEQLKLFLEVDGEETNLMDMDDDFNLEVDDGGGEGEMEDMEDGGVELELEEPVGAGG